MTRCTRCRKSLKNCTCPAVKTREQYIQEMGHAPNPNSWPEDLRPKVKLNVRVFPWRLAQVKALSKTLLKTQDQIVDMAIVALLEKFQGHTDGMDSKSYEAEILAEARASVSPKK